HRITQRLVREAAHEQTLRVTGLQSQRDVEARDGFGPAPEAGERQSTVQMRDEVRGLDGDRRIVVGDAFLYLRGIHPGEATLRDGHGEARLDANGARQVDDRLRVHTQLAVRQSPAIVRGRAGSETDGAVIRRHGTSVITSTRAGLSFRDELLRA